ncbi:acyltransferase family protein [Sphingomonas faeni]|uniref:acyltransferase family protein n=1 Tax=Sphingomonas faeni TaxID=185950 RepID=UPI002785E564|nr:acyltransferase [Sphingomonas faeni]MDQ0838836.1 peptidoglycan/LPS O-acetylase OafA/YrhL [Sphingomonas faeni]
MPNKVILTNIQQVRAIAAALVMVAHVLNSIMKRMFGVDEFLIDGGIGVDIFFVISGFIMVGVTHDKFGSLRVTKDFLIRRISRIVPIYWILTFVMAGLLIATRHPIGMYDLITNLSFYPVAGPEGKVRPILGQGWTLELEMMFYVIFSACLAFKKRVGMRILFVSLMILPIMGILELPYPFEFWTSGLIIEFLLGINLGLLYRNFQDN